MRMCVCNFGFSVTLRFQLEPLVVVSNLGSEPSVGATKEICSGHHIIKGIRVYELKNTE